LDFFQGKTGEVNVHGVSDVRQEEIHTAEPLVPEPSVLEVELAI
jgi:hypothetical protein